MTNNEKNCPKCGALYASEVPWINNAYVVARQLHMETGGKPPTPVPLVRRPRNAPDIEDDTPCQHEEIQPPLRVDRPRRRI